MEILKNVEIDELDKKIFFNFAFLNKVKKLNNSFLNEIKKICKLTLRKVLQGSKQQCGYNEIEVGSTKLPKEWPIDLIDYVKLHFQKEIPQKVKKYDYFRVGNKERLYGKLVKNVFFAIIYDSEKKSLGS